MKAVLETAAAAGAVDAPASSLGGCSPGLQLLSTPISGAQLKLHIHILQPAASRGAHDACNMHCQIAPALRIPARLVVVDCPQGPLQAAFAAVATEVRRLLQKSECQRSFSQLRTPQQQLHTPSSSSELDAASSTGVVTVALGWA